ncbi:MAG TPA: peptide chain release factor N(5)-glutamine methyltransferase [Gemmatimonadaceae bacterium]|nr:peptide chain release factor N(5)-glutamine methyltransferase [Gemmatimonadaceae bacterium]
MFDRLAIDLAGPGVPPARADARDLIAAVLDKPKFWPTANQNIELDERATTAIQAAGAKLVRGMPMQYAVGHTAFRHLELNVDQRVLIPRPETEMLVELVLGLSTQAGGTAADIGTGSGAIALALASEARFERIIATDISLDALDVAHANLGVIAPDKRVLVEFRQGSLLAPLAGERLRAIVSNPPYISPAESAELPALVRDWEPALALFSEDDGMAAIREIVRDAAEFLEPGGLLAMEIDARRAQLARECTETDTRYRDVEIRTDLTGRERFLVARRKER